MTESRLVYTSEDGRICPECSKPVKQCQCSKSGRQAASAQAGKRSMPADGVIRVQRETKGHGGKTVTVISGVTGGDSAIAALATTLKKRCGCGGSVKEGVILIQGDHADTIVATLTAQGLRCKRAGG